MTSKAKKISFNRLIAAPLKKSFFLFGPRGTGKSTWLKKTFPESATFDLLASETYNRLLTRPQDLLSLISPDQKKLPVIIDEVQRAPEILNEVHRLIENEKMIFVLTGSSARKLRKHGTNLLAGRAYTRNLFPLTACEMGAHFNLKQALSFGTLPGISSEENPQEFLESYVATYLREEVQQEGLTRNLAAFSRFLEVATFSQASPLVVTNVARDADVERKTTEEYFSILEDLMIGIRLPIFTKRAKRELLKKSKFFFFDAGVFNTLRPRGPLDSMSELSGLSLETLVFNELRALNAYKALGYELFYWRTKSKHEVDFVLYGERGLIAIEVKASVRLRQGDLSGLTLFKSDYPMTRAYVIYCGERKYHEDGIDIIPAKEFFAAAEKIIA